MLTAVNLHKTYRKDAVAVPVLRGLDLEVYPGEFLSIVGASVSPYLFYFYSAGAVEDGWDEGYIGINRFIAGLGMTFGGGIAVAVLVGAALVLHPRGIQVDRYEQIPLLLSSPLGVWGFRLFAASLAVACFGAALEIAPLPGLRHHRPRLRLALG